MNHQTKAITVIIDFALHRALCDTPEIHVAQLCQQDIIDQLIIVPLHHILLLKSHGVCTTQSGGVTVQIKHSLRLAFQILSKGAAAKLLTESVKDLTVFVL